MKKLLSAILAIAVIAMFIPTFTATASAATDWNGYVKISTPDDLKKMSGSSGKFYLTNDINMKDYGNWQSIDFSGTLDGNGYAIKNLTSTYGGLFDELGFDTDATIKNLGLYNVDISSSKDVGALANTHYLWVAVNIENCYVTGKVVCSGTNRAAAGFIGSDGGHWHSDIKIKNCYNKANIISNGSAGGIIGACSDSTNAYSLTNCVNSGTITGDGDYVGGIIGDANNVYMTSCYNYGTVKSKDSSVVHAVGGLVGYASNNTIMKNCATTGKIDIGTKASGSLAQGKTGVAKDDFKIQSTYKGFDFSKTWAINPDVNNGYPYLRSMSKVLGVTTEKSATVSEIAITLKKGDILQLSAIMTAGAASAVTWTSDNTSAATVGSSTGKVTAKGKGTAVITAKSGSVTRKITVVVSG